MLEEFIKQDNEYIKNILLRVLQIYTGKAFTEYNIEFESNGNLFEISANDGINFTPQTLILYPNGQIRYFLGSYMYVVDQSLLYTEIRKSKIEMILNAATDN